jgi:hypothetical protein
MISWAMAIPLEKSKRKNVSAILLTVDFIGIDFKSIILKFYLILIINCIEMRVGFSCNLTLNNSVQIYTLRIKK